MVRISLVAASLLTLAGCSDQIALRHGQEAKEIIAAVLAKQPDLVSQRKAFLARYPEEGSQFDGLIDIAYVWRRKRLGPMAILLGRI